MEEKNMLYRIRNVIKENIELCSSIVIILMLTYGYEITNWTLTVDEENCSYLSKEFFATAWIQEGRWGTALLKLLLPTHKVLPYYNGLCAVVILGVCAFCIGHFLDSYFSSKTASVVAAVVFLTTPIHSYFLMFDSFSAEVAIGYLLSILGGYYSVEWCFKRQKDNLVRAIVFTTFAIAIYQALYQVYACIVCALLLLDVFRNNTDIEKKKKNTDYIITIIKTISLLVLAVVIYQIINSVLQYFVGDSGYVSNFIRWTYVDFDTCVLEVRAHLELLFRNPEILYEGGDLLKVCYLICILTLGIALIKYKKNRVIIILCFIGLNISVCSNYILFAGSAPIRTMQVIPVYCCFMFFLLTIAISKMQWKNIVLVLAFLISMYNSSTVVEMFYSENMRQEQDKALLNRVVSEIEELELGEQPEYPVVITGTHNWEGKYSVKTEMFSMSMFETTQAYRKYKWMQILGYNYNTPTAEQQARAEEIAKDMPAWPYNGSVIVQEEMIIVNFGEN